MTGDKVIPFVGAFESTYLPRLDVDVTETTGHDRRRRDDLELLAATGVRTVRYPIRWHRVEDVAGHYDWSDTDQAFDELAEHGLTPIVDLLHHTSYPAWLDRDFADPRFGPAFLRFCQAVARRYPSIRAYTVFNEPFSTLFLAAHEGIWPPYHRGMEALVEVFSNVLPAFAEATRLMADLLPDATHLYVDTCERHTSGGAGADAYTALANDRRFFILDLLLGREMDPERPFVAEVLRAGGAQLLATPPGRVDVLGLDYYAHSQWHFVPDAPAVIPSPHPSPLASLILEYYERYQLPCMLSETNIRGYSSDRASWLRYTLEQCEVAVEAGVPLVGFCWFPFVDSCDWDSLLARADGNVDPVGVYWLDQDLARRGSTMSAAYAAAASGTPAQLLPAYRFQPPVSSWLVGYLDHMAHWEWQDPPPAEVGRFAVDPDLRIELRVRDAS